jgi:hypothetical protein
MPQWQCLISVWHVWQYDKMNPLQIKQLTSLSCNVGIENGYPLVVLACKYLSSWPEVRLQIDGILQLVAVLISEEVVWWFVTAVSAVVDRWAAIKKWTDLLLKLYINYNFTTAIDHVGLTNGGFIKMGQLLITDAIWKQMVLGTYLPMISCDHLQPLCLGDRIINTVKTGCLRVQQIFHNNILHLIGVQIVTRSGVIRIT